MIDPEELDFDIELDCSCGNPACIQSLFMRKGGVFFEDESKNHWNQGYVHVHGLKKGDWIVKRKGASKGPFSNLLTRYTGMQRRSNGGKVVERPPTVKACLRLVSTHFDSFGGDRVVPLVLTEEHSLHSLPLSLRGC